MVLSWEGCAELWKRFLSPSSNDDWVCSKSKVGKGFETSNKNKCLNFSISFHKNILFSIES